MFEPVIKWSGSKRSQAKQILQYMPVEIDTYYEPFCGGASVLYRLLHSGIRVKHYVCSDVNTGLIDLWHAIIERPEQVLQHYRTLWTEFNMDCDIQRKKEYFERIRARYNTEHNPLDFMFIMRTTTNGMPRYNKNGEFNNSLHITRNGINPKTLEEILYKWYYSLKENNVQFIACSYTDIKPHKQDFLYLDPPYANTKGMYYGAIDYTEFWKWLRNVDCKYVLSFDGVSGSIDNTYAVPTDLYTKHEYLLNGNSSFKRTIGKSSDSIVYESLYIK